MRSVRSAFLAASVFGFSWHQTQWNDTKSSKLNKITNEAQWNDDWDKSVYQKPSSSINSYCKLIILVRHGQYETGAETSEGKVLTNLGWEQAKEAGKRLRALGYNIDCIVHSNMIRARQTTAGILSELDEIQLKETGIMEITDCGTSQAETSLKTIGMAHSPLKSKSYPLVESALMAEGPPPVDPEPHSKSRKKCIANLPPNKYDEHRRHQERIDFSFSYFVHRLPISEAGQMALQGPKSCATCSKDPACPSPDCNCMRAVTGRPVEVVLFVGHANVFRYWLCRALQLPPEAWLRISLPHGSITELLVQNDCKRCQVNALRIGDDGHLVPKLQSR